MTPVARLALSQSVISGWERIMPAGRLADTMRMIGEECRALVAIGEDNPALRDRADALIARYQLLANRMKLN